MEISYLRRILLDQQSDFNSMPGGVARLVDLSGHIRSTDISVITGVRRCGKSTLLKQLSLAFPGYRHQFLDLESPHLTTFQLMDFEKCDQIWQEQGTRTPGQPTLLLLDEIQNIEGWERWVRYFSEKRRYKVVVTGSNSAMLSTELGTVLGGRYLTLELYPFSLMEFARFKLGDLKNLPQTTAVLSTLNGLLDDGLTFGMFPKPYIERSSQVYPHLFEDIIKRDVARRKRIRKLTPLFELGRLLARDNARLLNATTTSKLLSLGSPKTLLKYLGYFQEAYLFFQLRRFSRSARKQIRGLSKIYCIDPILADSASAQAPRLPYALENMVFLELHKQGQLFGYWLSSNGYEVDFVRQAPDGSVHAIQVCYELFRPETLTREVRALLACKSELKANSLTIVTRDQPDPRTLSLIPAEIKVQTLLEFLGLWGPVIK